MSVEMVIFFRFLSGSTVIIYVNVVLLCLRYDHDLHLGRTDYKPLDLGMLFLTSTSCSLKLDFFGAKTPM
jgi:hypothetical protein